MRSPLNRALRLLLGGAAVAVAVIVGASLYVQFRYADRIVSVAEAPSSGVALVFGAGLSSGEPSPILAQRLDAALQLFRAGKVQRLLLSGDNWSDRFHDETRAMRDYLLQQGVPAEALLTDDVGVSTYDTCARAIEVFQIRRGLLVTQAFHLPRALYIANSLGMDAHGVAADESRRAGAEYRLREFFSRPLALAMVLIRKEPASAPPSASR